MWSEIVASRAFVGGWLVDYGDSQDRRMVPGYPFVTRIRALELSKNREWFEVNGEDFTCGGSTKYLDVTGSPEFGCPKGGLPLRNPFMGHEFHILPPGAQPPRAGELDRQEAVS